jgi:hypothetical protein
MKTRLVLLLAMAFVVIWWAAMVGVAQDEDPIGEYIGMGKCMATEVDPCPICTIFFDAETRRCYAQ